MQLRVAVPAQHDALREFGFDPRLAPSTVDRVGDVLFLPAAVVVVKDEAGETRLSALPAHELLRREPRLLLPSTAKEPIHRLASVDAPIFREGSFLCRRVVLSA